MTPLTRPDNDQRFRHQILAWLVLGLAGPVCGVLAGLLTYSLSGSWELALVALLVAACSVSRLLARDLPPP